MVYIQGKINKMNDYNKQAKDFLAKTNTTLKIELATPQKSPLWVKKGEKHGFHYSITLENKNAKYTFDFWNSIKNREIIEAIQAVNFCHSIESNTAEHILRNEAGLKAEEIKNLYYKKEKKLALIEKYTPTEYDILACLSPLYEDNLEDFASTFGYDSDSITALKIFEACKEQDRNIRKLWDREEIEALTEIQ